MTGIILGITLIMLLCVLAEKFSDRLGMPALILFMFIGMLFGSDGIFKVPLKILNWQKESVRWLLYLLCFMADSIPSGRLA